MVRWSEDENKNFYDIVSRYFLDLMKEKTLNLNSSIFKLIHSDFSLLHSRDELSLLHRLTHIELFEIGGKYKRNPNHKDCYVKKKEPLDYEQFQVKKLIELYKNEKIESDLKQKIIDLYTSSDIENNEYLFELIAKETKRTVSFIKYVLITSNIIHYNSENFSSINKKNIKKSKVKDSSLTLQEKLSEINYTHGIEKPVMIFSNDGTGTGKSYGVVNQYIKGVKNQKLNLNVSGHRNLIFTSIQKNQLETHIDHLNSFIDLDIPYLMLRSEEDTSNILVSNMSDDKEKIKETFKKWILSYDKNVKNKEGNSEFKRRFDVFKSTYNNLLFKEEEYNRIEKENFLNEKLEKLESIKNTRKAFFQNMCNLTLFILNHVENIKEICKKTKVKRLNNKDFCNIEDLFFEIVCFNAPLEVCKYRPCAIICSADKFKRATIFSDAGKKARYGHKIIDIISSKIKKDYAENEDGHIETIAKHINDNDESIKKYLNDVYFKINDKSYFIENDISFTIIFDEEHDNYQKFLTEYSYQNILNEKINIVHALSTLYRLNKNVQEYKLIGIEDEIEEIKKVYLENIQKNIDKFCSFSNNRKICLDEFLSNFSDNFGTVYIDSSNVEYIINICKSLFSLSSQRFFNNEELKKIKIKTTSSYCSLQIDDKEQEDLYSLHDFLQVLMSILYASKDITDKVFLKDLSLAVNDVKSQNESLSSLIKNASSNKEYIESIFETAINNEIDKIIINNIYTYFVPKIIFSINPVPSNMITKSSETKIKCIFAMEIVTELPEVSLMRLVTGTKNAIICLSATRGFNGVYGGYYSDKMLNYFSVNKKSSPILDFEIIKRDKIKDSANLRDFIESRKQKRKNISLNIITDDKSLSGIKFSGNDLIKKNIDSNKIYGDLFIKNISSSASFLSMNRFRQNEIESILRYIEQSIDKRESSIIISLTNEFSNFFRENNSNNCFFNLYKGDRYMKVSGLSDGDEGKIFEFRPDRDSELKVRVIFFDASLGKNNNLSDYMNVNKNTIVLIISSYKSAGTGLNFVLHDVEEDMERDFDSLCIVNSPFYTAVKDKNNGFNNLFNYFLLLKKDSYTGNKRLVNFDSNLMAEDNLKHLSLEHQIEILKSIMQATGRIERKNGNDLTNIYISEDFFRDVSIYYYKFNELNKDDVLMDSLSMLNQHFLKSSLIYLENKKFSKMEDLEIFENECQIKNDRVKEFFEVEYKDLLNEFRQSKVPNVNMIDFFESIRSIEIIQNPENYMRNIKKTLSNIDSFDDRKKRRIINIIESFYIERPNNIEVCLSNDKNYYTDLSNSQDILDLKNVIPKLDNKILEAEDDNDVKSLMKTIESLKSDISKKIPVPYLIPLIIGNVGEYVFSQFLKINKIETLSASKLIELKFHSLYELFDFYFMNKKNELICVDVKMWSNKNKESASLYLNNKFKQKENTIDLKTGKSVKKKYLYINTYPNKNKYSVNELQPDYREFVIFLNLIILRNKNCYKDKRYFVYNEFGEKEVKTMQIGAIKEEYAVDEKILKIIRGE